MQKSSKCQIDLLAKFVPEITLAVIKSVWLAQI